jgi:hypothetical protein
VNRSTAIGAVALLVAATAAGVALDRSRQPAAASVGTAPLSATDRRTLEADRSLVGSLSRAFAEIPRAASDATRRRSSTSAAASVLSGVAALEPLDRAVRDPEEVTGPLVTSYDDVVDGDASGVSAGQLVGEVNTLQEAEGDIVPAVRVVALHAGRHLAAGAALTTIEQDPHTPELARLVADWQQIYGAFILVGQAASQ